MTDNQQNQSNAASISTNGPVDNIEEDIGKMKIESNKEEEEEEPEKYPVRAEEPNCLYYLRTGMCGYGTACRFNHPPDAVKTALNRSELPQRDGQPECGYYVKTGTCKFGSTCKYHHPLDRPDAGQTQLNSLDLPIRQDQKSCLYYMRKGTCKFGHACKFNHPELPSVLPVSSPVAGIMGSSTPPHIFPYPGPLQQPWPANMSSYMTSSPFHFQATYMPLGFTSLQGPIGTQSWNGYMGNLNAASASNWVAAQLFYNPKTQGDIISDGQVDTWNMNDTLPERPGQPECRHFISTGTCSYGSNCKFHHPKERTTQLAVNNLGPHELPLRPGEEICAYYQSNGKCKYGSNCKFNHPFVAGCVFGMSTGTLQGNSQFPSQMNSTVTNSSDNSLSKSSKITDWIQKPETVKDKNQQNTDAKDVEVSHEPVVHQDDASPSPELIQVQAD